MNKTKRSPTTGKNFKVQPYTIVGLARMYGVSKRTFKVWLRPFSNDLGERQGYYYTVKQVEMIIDKIGLPSEIPLDEK